MIWLWIMLMAVIVAAFFIPIKIDIYTKIKGNNVYYVDNQKQKNDITIVIKIFGFLPVYKYNKNKKKIRNIKKGKTQTVTIKETLEILKRSVSKEEFKLNDLTNKIIKWGKKVKFHKFILIGGFNTEDYVKNAYINASINSIICMFINANQDNFNLKKLYYQVSISNYKYYLTLDATLSFPIINNIDVFKTIIQIIYRLKKKKREKEKQSINNIVINKQQENNYIKMQQKYDIT